MFNIAHNVPRSFVFVFCLPLFLPNTLSITLRQSSPEEFRFFKMAKSAPSVLFSLIAILFLFQITSCSPIANNDEPGRGKAEIDGNLTFVDNVDTPGGPDNVDLTVDKAASASIPATSPAASKRPLRESITYVTQEAIEAYEKHGDCYPAFFDITEDNLQQANLSLWFNDFLVSKQRANPQAYDQFGEISLYAREIMQTSGFECNLQSKGCNRVPSCRDVTDHLERRNLGLSTAELLDQTRKIYFTFTQLDSIAKYISTMHELLGTTQSNINGFIMSLITDFTTQSSTDSEIACALIKFGYEMGFQIAQTALSFGLGSIPSGAGEYVLAGDKIVKAGQNKKQQEFAANSHWIWTGLDLVHKVAQMEMAFEGMKWTDDWYGANAEMETKNYHLVMAQAYVGGLCAEVGGDMPNQNWERATKMASYASKGFMDMRAILERLMKTLSKGNGLKNGISYLSLYLEHDEMFKAVQRLKQGHSVYESTMTQRFKESLITSALANSKCYQKCANRPGDIKAQDACKSKWANVDSRYCPEDDEFTACQVQCFTTQTVGNRERTLIGKMALPQYALSVKQLLKDSLHHYHETGNAPPALGQLAGNGSSDILALERTLNTEVSGLALPVCHSANVKLTEFDDKIHYGLKYTQNQQFPCSCGDWRSNETQPFLARLGLAANQSDFQTGAAKELFTQICPHNLKKHAPLTRYLAYCNLGIQFPDKSTGGGPAKYPSSHPDHWVHNMHQIKTGRGAHRHCEVIAEQVNDMDEKAGNMAFCRKKTREMAEVIKEGRAHAENLRGGFVVSYKEACRRFLKDNKA
ncbi:hypothetical protein ONS96_004204 [Cadophora gregata f. sp. sojae]|nr:hypothetical protein ONS96_004204 [Cadophora gregata f. sp. sojae]